MELDLTAYRVSACLCACFLDSINQMYSSSGPHFMDQTICGMPAMLGEAGEPHRYPATEPRLFALSEGSIVSYRVV